ncbi:MAG: HRDC domain-containing protein [Desulfosarcinaceae bacterium]|nr:HRDC domain-containing protein [Desulfosarcinaceae bacterium]
MDFAPPTNYRLIDTGEALERFAKQLKSATCLAVDLEADSMFHFQERVCLIQIATREQTVVIDPIECSDLAVLQPLFSDPAICKIFHGADYDVRSLFRDFAIEVNNLFDTQLASMYLGYRETGLDAVLQRHFGVKLDKRYQKKDWSQRPLPTEMIDYAAADVAYLIPLKEQLEADLAAKERLGWVAEECALLSRVRPPSNDGQPLYLRFKGAGRLSPRNLAVLENLLRYRRKTAKRKDRPLFKILSNTSLLKIANAQPTTVEALETAKAISPKQRQMYARGLIGAVNKALELRQAELPVYPRRKPPRMPRLAPERIKLLKGWRDTLAARLDLDPALLLTKALISAIAVANPADFSALLRTADIRRWQCEAFGREILAILDCLRVPPK